MNWIILKALNELYTKGSIKKNETISKNGLVNYFINSLKILEETLKKITVTPGFASIYKSKYLQNYIRYHSFLTENVLLKPQSRFEEQDIIILMNIKSWKDDGVLDGLRKQIIDSDESLRGISLMFFKNEKYLDDRLPLIDALKQILEIEQFANEKDQQYIYKLECFNPVVIVLCENLDFLTKPIKPRQYGIELWYAGGKNIDKLSYADNRNLPIFYSCDWDYDGLFIIFPLVKQKIPTIQLLTPTGEPKGIEGTEHASKWDKKSLPFETLYFNITHEKQIKQLVENNQWIIEESNDLLVMLHLQKVKLTLNGA